MRIFLEFIKAISRGVAFLGTSLLVFSLVTHPSSTPPNQASLAVFVFICAAVGWWEI